MTFTVKLMELADPPGEPGSRRVVETLSFDDESEALDRARNWVYDADMRRAEVRDAGGRVRFYASRRGNFLNQFSPTERG